MRVAVLLLVACASSPPPQPAATATNDNAIERERLRRAELAAAQNERLDEQATALAATCEAGQPARPRCLPSCYAKEAEDPRKGKRVAGAVEIMHLACTRTDAAPYVLADELGALDIRTLRGRFPAANKKGSWQAEVEAAVSAALEPELSRGDVVRVTGDWKQLSHPATKEKLRCVAVSHYTRSLRTALDGCGGRGDTACEATGSSAAHGLNVVRYRLLEAQRLQAAGKSTECQQAALEAIAVARGMPRWRQYMALNTTGWKSFKRYRTRFDGILDEDALFATAIALGTEAEAVHRDCGGGNPKTVVADEQSFHTCW